MSFPWFCSIWAGPLQKLQSDKDSDQPAHLHSLTSLSRLHEEALGIGLPIEWPVKVLIRLDAQADLSVHWGHKSFEPCHEIMILFVRCKLILQTCMCSHPMGLDVFFLVGPFVYFHTSCVQTVKALARLHGCAGSPEPSLLAFAYVISTIISFMSRLICRYCRASAHFGTIFCLLWFKTTDKEEVEIWLKMMKNEGRFYEILAHRLSPSSEWDVW